MAKKYDKLGVPHRTLKDGDRGKDVYLLQDGINVRRTRRGLPKIGRDGEVGPETREAFGDMAFAIGLNHRRLTPGNQALMRWPWRRDASMKAKEKRRSNRAPMRIKATRVARGLVGVVEQGGNNIGPMVSKIIRANGGTPGEAWCGDFVAYCYRAAGSKVVQRAWAAVRFLGFLTGMKIVKAPKQGDIVCYKFDHTGLFYKWLEGGYFLAIEGNTGSSGAVSDSSGGGDGVKIKKRHISQVSRFVEVLR